MTVTYVSPEQNNKDAIRFLLGDTDINNALLQDEEINWLITRWLDTQGSLEYVAAVAAETIGARFAREANYSADGVSISLANLGQQFRDLAASLRSQHKSLLVGGQVDVGGITPGEELQPDTKNFDFGTGIHDNHEAGRQNYGSRDFNSPYYFAEEMPGA
jgi:hypothetical protein